ncbi:hypothetical protein [Enterococcus pallens]|uniref:Uncharacterized protein n=1 Tax=Enterococcus pallens ATCC BAA-351 TaxID=1158607 RepID=R2PSP7_9ENTE|nr:hypothetical protein [Enterococcus pallens]EOH86328.1 hypothetical protein UAU_05250 [Enterococcus pallens ATCC BAA-351]EOU09451.1 hypothetical protein I588_05184 [Enterococcus pallens ATCC BAA-351]OJG77552.1 hypothetical protein RV10_GL002386 [Enterococcus pallens]
MKKLEVNLREPEESDYGWAYLAPYLEKSDGKRRPAYQALEQIFREHEMYKTIAENMASMQKEITGQLDKIQKEVHFTLLRSGDAEKSARTLLHLWNSYNFDNNVTSYLSMGELVTPPLEKAMHEVGQYYKELSAKKRSRSESVTTVANEKSMVTQVQNLPKKEESSELDSDNNRETFADWTD